MRFCFFSLLQGPRVSLWLAFCRLIFCLFCWCLNCIVMFMCSLPDWGWLAGLQFRPLQLPGSLLRRSRLRVHPSWRHYGQVPHRSWGQAWICVDTSDNNKHTKTIYECSVISTGLLQFMEFRLISWQHLNILSASKYTDCHRTSWFFSVRPNMRVCD